MNVQRTIPTMNHREAADSADNLRLATCSVDMRFPVGDADRAVRLLLSVKGDILTKRGCRACDVATEAADAGVVHYREEWESEEAFREHVRSEEFRRVLIAMDMSSEEPRIVVGNLSGHGGMEYLRSMREADPSSPR
jgi:quinol monooxygenase YgiN